MNFLADPSMDSFSRVVLILKVLLGSGWAAMTVEN
jgi:hypothetical protein